MARISSIVAIFVLLLAACEKKAPESPDASKDVPVDAASDTAATDTKGDALAFPSNQLKCSPESARSVEAWFTTMAEWKGSVTWSAVDELVELERNAPAFDAPIFVHVSSKGVRVGLRDVWSPHEKLAGELDDAVNRKKREMSLLGQKWSAPGFALAIAPDVPWGVVRAVIGQALGGDTGRVEFAFTYPRVENLGRPSRELVAELREVFSVAGAKDRQAALQPPEERSERHANMYAGCEAGEKLANSLARAVPEERAQVLAESIGDVWLECECKPDIEWIAGLQSLSWGEKPVGRVAMDFAAAGTSPEIDPETPWREASSILLEMNGPVVLGGEAK